jgi:hypothetical protein
MKIEIVGLLTLAVLSLASGVLAQQQPIMVKGGHQLGETAEQFFAEGHEKEMLSACAVGDFKSLNQSDKRQAKKYCGELADTRQQAMGGKRREYQSGGEPSEMRMDTFTFDGGHLVKVELLYSAPSPEYNYRGKTFEEIFAGVKQAYGPPTSDNTQPTYDIYGVKYFTHHELWLAPLAAILITDQPKPGGSTTLFAFTRAEYDRMMAAEALKAANRLK